MMWNELFHLFNFEFMNLWSLNFLNFWTFQHVIISEQIITFSLRKPYRYFFLPPLSLRICFQTLSDDCQKRIKKSQSAGKIKLFKSH